MRNDPMPLPHLRKGVYFTITNCMNGLALSMPKTNKYTKDKPQFQEWDPNNINQLWMLDEISTNRYEIVHAVSTLVLQCLMGSNLCKLQFGKQKSSQLYYLEQGSALDRYKLQNMPKKTEGIQYQPPLPHVVKEALQEEKMISNNKREGSRIRNKSYNFKAGERYVAKIRIKQKQKSRKYLFCDTVNRSINQNAIKQVRKPDKNQKLSATQTKLNILKFMEIDLGTQAQSSLWQIREVYNEENQILAQTCFITSFRSGDALDVPQASDKQGVQIIQYPCNFRFNQRWIFKKVDEANGYNYYMIKNAKSGLYLDIKGQSAKEGIPIIQWDNHEGKNQIWRLEQQGKRVYLIRSALDKQLLLGIRQNSLKQAAQLVTSKIETDCFWTIYGYIPN